jgi:hypothetical protein
VGYCGLLVLVTLMMLPALACIHELVYHHNLQEITLWISPNHISSIQFDVVKICSNVFLANS